MRYLHMVPRGKLYAFPTGKTQACQDLEAHAGLVKALKAKKEHVRRMALRHWRKGHMPKAPPEVCGDCAQGKYRKGDGTKGPAVPKRELLVEVGFDLIGPLVESPDGNVYKLVGVTSTTGVGCSRGIPDKKSATILPHVISMLSEIRQHHNYPDTVTMRFHTDVDKSFDGILGAYALDNAWLRTTTEGYDSNGNAIVERRNEKLDQGLRTLLLQATGGRLYYEELWDVAMDHIHDLINHAPEAGGTSPIEKAGGDPISIDDMEVFGCLVYYYEAPERRSAPKQTDPSGRQGIWVGRASSPTGAVSGGHKIMPLEYNKGVWQLGPTIVRSYVTPVSTKYPLRTTAAKGADPKKYEAFVERCSLNAEEADVYVVDRILDVRVVSDEVEYRVKWRGWTSRYNSWEPAANLLGHGAEEMVREYHSTHRDKMNPLKLAYMVMNLELMTEDDKAVAHLMKRHKLGGTLADWKPGYTSELESVISKRCTEVFGDEYNRVLKKEKVVPLRMNPEAKYDGGILQRLKMRLIVKGFLEPKEWDGKTDSPTAMTSTVRQLVAMGVTPTSDGMIHIDDDVISVGDISTAFLLGDEYKEGEVDRYVSYKAYPTAHKRIFKLRGSLYGQRDAPHRWWATLTSWLETEGWVPSTNDPSLYHYPAKQGKGVKHGAMAGMTICTHVDDILTRGGRAATQYFWDRVASRFPIKGWEVVEYDNPVTYCAKRISKVKRGEQVWYTIDQTRDIEVFLAEAGMTSARATSAPMPYKQDIMNDTTPLSDQEHKQYRSWVGSLSYFLHTRYDIAYEVHRLAQFLQAPTKGAMKALRKVMAYLATVPDKRLQVPRVKGDTWHMYSDSDHAGDKVMGTNKSHTGVMIMLNGMPVFWRSNKQPKTSLSSAQAEIYALSEACKDANKVSWIHEEMGRCCTRPLRVYVDNAAGISFQQSTCASSKLGGIFDNRWDWVKELKDQSQFTATKVATEKNVADMFTKCLTEPVRARLFSEIDAVANDCASR